MMKDHKSSRARMLAGATAIAALAGLSAAFGTPSFAHPHPEAQPQAPAQAQPGEERRERRTIVRTYRHDRGEAAAGHGEHGANGDREQERVMVMVHRGAAGEHGERDIRVHGRHGEIMAADCDDGQATNVDETSDGERTRVMLCSQGNATPAERAERLQRVLGRLAQDSELSEAQRARVVEALNREIARLRAQ